MAQIRNFGFESPDETFFEDFQRGGYEDTS